MKIVAWIGFAVVLSFHVASFVPESGVLTKHIGYTAVFVILGCVAPSFLMFISDAGGTLKDLSSFNALGKRISSGYISILGLLFFYTPLIFLVSLSASEFAVPTYSDGMYSLMNHGKFIREITQAEYFVFERLHVRAMSSGLLLFTFLSIVANSLKPKEE